MGITGLIPFLEKASRKVHVRELTGATVAIDTYCWLHKGVVGCAEKLLRGEKTDIYIQYYLKQLEILIAYDVKPILVFDGRHLPAKKHVEDERRKLRKEAKEKVKQLLAEGRTNEARQQMQRSIDVSHEMALELIKECRKRNIDCIVAPYEADGQLAYLNLSNIAQYVITEDSDLVLFGCKKILFKFCFSGGLLVDSDKLHLAMGCRPDKYSFDKFRWICILSGCDYLKSLNGIGLAKAKKFFLMTEETDMRKALGKIPNYLNMRTVVVSDEYKEGFLRAEATFKHMIVFDPIRRCLTRLTNVDESTDASLLINAGEFFDESTALQLALGNIDPRTMKKLDDWHPDYSRIKVNSQLKTSKHLSIWKGEVQTPRQNQKQKNVQSKKSSPITPLKQIVKKYSKQIEENQIAQLEEDIIESYANESPVKTPNPKRQKIETANVEITPEVQKKISKNPFKAHSSTAQSPLKITPKSSLIESLKEESATIPENNNEIIKSNLFQPEPTTNKNQLMEDLRRKLLEAEKTKKISPVAVQKRNIAQCNDSDGTPTKDEANESPKKRPKPELNLDDLLTTNEPDVINLAEEKSETNSQEAETSIVSILSASSSGTLSDTMIERLEPNIILEESNEPFISQDFSSSQKENTDTRQLSVKQRSNVRVSGLSKKYSKPANQKTLSAFGFTSNRK